MVKNLPAVQEIWVRSLGHEDLLKKGIATHYLPNDNPSILAWRIPWTRGAWQALVHRVTKKRLGTHSKNN